MNGPHASGSYWDAAYASRPDVELSWYRAAPDVSLQLLDRFAARTGSVIDVGAGSAPLARALMDAGWRDVTVAQYRKFCEATGTQTGRMMPAPPKWGWIETHPMVNITWDDATAYAAW